ncbi:MAG TPA: sigma-70 family RNA polymerase sigma factor [Stellaceae bacterium]|nr:sigma-70 family RNA polymerase sigma factor [Stellaceae bacterium]
MADADWRGLMIAAQSGSGGAYRQLLGELATWLQRYYARRLPPAMIDDAVQDALLALHEKRHTYDPSKPFGPWLAAIARYKWIDRLRAMRADATEELPDDLAVGDHGDGIQNARSLESWLDRLKPAQADVIRLVKLQGLSTAEAAERTGQTVSLVKVNIHRGLNRLSAIVLEESDEL